MRLADLKSLVKAGVLLANVLPVVSGFWLALWYTDQSLADSWGLCLLTIAGSTFVMAGALILNNWYDVDIDTIMARTKRRPTVTGNIPLKTVLLLGIFFTALGLCLLAFFTTVEAAAYALIGWIAYVLLYTMWSKRRFTANTLIGSVSGAVTPLIGWSAVESSFHDIPIVLFLILFIWQMPHAYATAMKNFDDYKAAGVVLLPVVHGFAKTKKHIAAYIACLIPLPFFLQAFGTAFIVICTVLNVVWLALGIGGFYAKDDKKWTRAMFLYSVNYITILFILMIVVTLPMFA
ncbi:MAG TPA: heme o synthase [Bacilli bacterium]